MKAYILSVAGIILLSATVSIILPSGKMGKFVKGAMKLFVLIVLVSPFGEFIRGRLPEQAESTFKEDVSYLESCATILNAQDERSAILFLEEEFGVEARVSARRSIEANFPLEKILIVITDFGINAEEEHINIMTRIEEAVEEKFGCDAEVS